MKYIDLYMYNIYLLGKEEMVLNWVRVVVSISSLIFIVSQLERSFQGETNFITLQIKV